MNIKQNGCTKPKINYKPILDLIILAVKIAMMYHNQSFDLAEILDLIVKILEVAVNMAKRG